MTALRAPAGMRPTANAVRSRGARQGACLGGRPRRVEDAIEGVEVLDDQQPGETQQRVQPVRHVEQRAQRVHVLRRQHAPNSIPSIAAAAGQPRATAWDRRGARPLELLAVCATHVSYIDKSAS